MSGKVVYEGTVVGEWFEEFARSVKEVIEACRMHFDSSFRAKENCGVYLSIMCRGVMLGTRLVGYHKEVNDKTRATTYYDIAQNSVLILSINPHLPRSTYLSSADLKEKNASRGAIAVGDWIISIIGLGEFWDEAVATLVAVRQGVLDRSYVNTLLWNPGIKPTPDRALEYFKKGEKFLWKFDRKQKLKE